MGFTGGVGEMLERMTSIVGLGILALTAGGRWWWLWRISEGVMLKSNITHDFHDQTNMCV